MDNPNKKQRLIVFYKLLGDVLFLSLIFLFLALVVEALIPGLIYSHLSFAKIILFVLSILGVLVYLESKIEIPASEKNQKSGSFFRKPLGIALSIVFSLLVLDSLLKFNSFLILAITATVLAIAFFLQKIYFGSSK